MTDPATKPKPLTAPCPDCGGTNVSSTTAQAADGRPGPNGKPVKAGQTIHECGDCGAIAKTPPKPAAKQPATPKRSSSSRSRTTTKKGGNRGHSTATRRRT